MKKTLILLTILLLVVFMVGCENSINPIEPQTQNDNDGISLGKKGGTPGPPDKGGAQEADYTAQFSGGVTSGLWPWTKDVSSGATRISTGYGQDMTLNLSALGLPESCSWDETYTGILMIGESHRKDPFEAHAWFWFNANDITYILMMWGDFVDVGYGLWQPNVNGNYKIDLKQWELTTESNKHKSACKIGLTDFGATLVVTVAMKP